MPLQAAHLVRLAALFVGGCQAVPGGSGKAPLQRVAASGRKRNWGLSSSPVALWCWQKLPRHKTKGPIRIALALNVHPAKPWGHTITFWSRPGPVLRSPASPGRLWDCAAGTPGSGYRGRFSFSPRWEEICSPVGALEQRKTAADTVRAHRQLPGSRSLQPWNPAISPFGLPATSPQGAREARPSLCCPALPGSLSHAALRHKERPPPPKSGASRVGLDGETGTGRGGGGAG